MASSEENNFEESWKKAFENSNELPPTSVWDKIEARLDANDNRIVIIPFWQRWQTFASIAAASIAVLFVLLGDVWFSETTPVVNKKEMINIPSSQKLDLSEQVIPKEKSIISPAQKNEKIAIISLKKSSPTFSDIKTRRNESFEKLPLSVSKIEKNVVKNDPNVAFRKKKNGNEPATNKSLVNTPKNMSKPFDETPSELVEIVQSTDDDIADLSILSLSFLEIKQMHSLIGLTKRQPWVTYQVVSDEQKVTQVPSKQYWTSVSFLPASYNAGVIIGEKLSTGGTFGAAKPTVVYNSVPSDARANRAAFSYALQWHGGVQLAQRWSLETGFNYLQGNSIFEATNGFNVFTNSYINNLEAAVSASDNNKQVYSLSSVNTDKAQVQPLSTTQNIDNSYQFLQIPLQAGYALVKPKKKFSVWLLGGLVNNIFLRNSFKSGQERTVVLNGNNPYQRLSFSASSGLRFQYKMNKHWTSQLTGTYQLALGNATKQTAAFEAYPQLLGLGAGLRYGF